MNEFYEKMDRYCETSGEREALGWTTFFVKTGQQRDMSGFGVYATPCETYLVAASGYAVVVREDGGWVLLDPAGTERGDVGGLGDLPDLRGGCPVKSLLNDSKNRAEQAVREMDYDASVVRYGALRVAELMRKAAAFAEVAEFLED